MKLIVDIPQRKAKMRAHTATHVLHAILGNYFPNTKQAGSLVDSDYLRFDFYADTMLTSEQLQEIEKKINQIIYDALPVSVQEMWYNDAVASGAKAFFEDTYGDLVRVVRVGDMQHAMSVELCGWTHVSNTADIGSCKIISQEAVASGVKRIVAVTGPKVIESAQEMENTVVQIAGLLGVQTKQVLDKIHKMQKEYGDISSSLEKLQNQYLVQYFSQEKPQHKDGYGLFILPEAMANIQSSSVNAYIKQHIDTYNQSILIVFVGGGYSIIAPQGQSAKQLQQKLGLQGGGSDALVQWKDPRVNDLVA